MQSENQSMISGAKNMVRTASFSTENIIQSSSMGKQTTISRKERFSGIGLHTGNITAAEFNPAEENTGIVFCRSDMPGKPCIRASVEHVLDVTRGTTIGDKTVKIHTVEHILAACYALNLDNVIIELNANEPPVADGSSLPFVETLLHAGIVELNAERTVFNVREPIRYATGETFIEALPPTHKNLFIRCGIIYNHPLIQKQEIEFELTPEYFMKEIAPSRTFCLDYEIEVLKKKGLAKGGSLDNAVVIGLDTIHCKGPLRFPDEFVRHKVLDLIGDISLLSAKLHADIYAERTGHAHNINFTKQLYNYIKIHK